MYITVVPPSLVPGGDIHQKSVVHYFVVGVSVLYLTPAVRASCAVVVPPVAEYLTTPKCQITDQKDSCAQSENVIFRHFKVQFSSSIVSPDPHCNSHYSCELSGSYPTITPFPSSLSLPPYQPPLPDRSVAVMSPSRTTSTFIVVTTCSQMPLLSCTWSVERWESVQLL